MFFYSSVYTFQTTVRVKRHASILNFRFIRLTFENDTLEIENN